MYAPLAHRMGLYNLKTELEDLSMKYMEPAIYKEIAKKLSETKRERTKYINEFIRPIKEKLSAASFDFEIQGRPKSIHSIWNKIKKKEFRIRLSSLSSMDEPCKSNRMCLRYSLSRLLMMHLH